MGAIRGGERMTVNHEVVKGGNLDLLLRGFHGIGNRFVDAVGGGLQAIALALSTPHDNSAEVQKKIDDLAASLKTDADALEKVAPK